MPTEQEKQWIAAWRRAGPELERLRNAELRQLDEAEGTRLATFLGLAHPVVPRGDSGLLEFQRLMKKWRAQRET
ncbi:MAG: hypothetical protein WD049_02340 [Candidatus Paceibacterota bacterium]